MPGLQLHRIEEREVTGSDTQGRLFSLGTMTLTIFSLS